jgi:hypothetical protein
VTCGSRAERSRERSEAKFATGIVSNAGNAVIIGKKRFGRMARIGSISKYPSTIFRVPQEGNKTREKPIREPVPPMEYPLRYRQKLEEHKKSRGKKRYA